MKKHGVAILLAGGSGKRMNSNVAKQYMMLGEKPVIWYGLQAFEQSPEVDLILLVVGKGEIPHAQKEIVEKYGFTKEIRIAEGGAERYLSVGNALTELVNTYIQPENRENCDYMTENDTPEIILVHDGARPFVTQQIIEDTISAAKKYGAACAAVPVKDTIRVADENGFSASTPDRSTLYAMQTPQTFRGEVLLNAYAKLNQLEDGGTSLHITDDAMVVETMLGVKARFVPAGYDNLKITTPEDLIVAQTMLDRK